jgi:hypothetical protein
VRETATQQESTVSCVETLLLPDWILGHHAGHSSLVMASASALVDHTAPTYNRRDHDVAVGSSCTTPMKMLSSFDYRERVLHTPNFILPTGPLLAIRHCSALAAKNVNDNNGFAQQPFVGFYC